MGKTTNKRVNAEGGVMSKVGVTVGFHLNLYDLLYTLDFLIK